MFELRRFVVLCAGLCLILFGIVLLGQNFDIFSPQPTQQQAVVTVQNSGTKSKEIMIDGSSNGYNNLGNDIKITVRNDGSEGSSTDGNSDAASPQDDQVDLKKRNNHVVSIKAKGKFPVPCIECIVSDALQRKNRRFL